MIEGKLNYWETNLIGASETKIGKSQEVSGIGRMKVFGVKGKKPWW